MPIYRVGCGSYEGGEQYFFEFPQALNKRQLYALVEAAVSIAAREYMEDRDHGTTSPSIEDLFYCDREKSNRFTRAIEKLGGKIVKAEKELWFFGWARPHSPCWTKDSGYHTKKLIKYLEKAVCPLRIGDDNHPLAKRYVSLSGIKHKVRGGKEYGLCRFEAMDIVERLWNDYHWFGVKGVAFMVAGKIFADQLGDVKLDVGGPPYPSYPLAKKLIERLLKEDLVYYENADQSYHWKGGVR
jgi:hypothetical protein